MPFKKGSRVQVDRIALTDLLKRIGSHGLHVQGPEAAVTEASRIFYYPENGERRYLDPEEVTKFTTNPY